jgi:hypothetical protein
MMGIPFRLYLALQADGWFTRQTNIWHKTNLQPESVEDRTTTAHEYVFQLAKSNRCYYDQEAVKEKASTNTNPRGKNLGPRARAVDPGDHHGRPKANRSYSASIAALTEKRNRRSVWSIESEPCDWEMCRRCRRVFTGSDKSMIHRDSERKVCPCGAEDWLSHSAVYPQALVEPCILAGTSEHGCCAECGAPWRRLVEKKKSFESGSGRSGRMPVGKVGGRLQGGGTTLDVRRGPVLKSRTIGWEPGCECKAPRQPAVVLDPFIGTGTTALVSLKGRRDFVGIELNEEYICLAEARLEQELAQAKLF